VPITIYFLHLILNLVFISINPNVLLFLPLISKQPVLLNHIILHGKDI